MHASSELESSCSAGDQSFHCRFPEFVDEIWVSRENWTLYTLEVLEFLGDLEILQTRVLGALKFYEKEDVKWTTCEVLFIRTFLKLAQ